jgi:hypothetical protein
MYVMLCLLGLFLSDDRPRPEGGNAFPIAEPRTAPADSAAILAACEKMSDVEYYAFVERLGKNKDFESLAAIYQSTVYNHEYAANVATENMPHDKAVAFCSKFEPFSQNWKAAFRALKSHPKEAVIAYVKKLGMSSNPYIRVQCYELCMRAGWDDLVEAAKRDLNNPLPVCLCPINALGNRETVGWHADIYVGTIEQKRKDAKKSD